MKYNNQKSYKVWTIVKEIQHEYELQTCLINLEKNNDFPSKLDKLEALIVFCRN